MPVSHRRAPRVARDATVYTNAPIRRGEALIAHLCTLLRSQGHSQPKLTAQQCTQTPQFGAERPDPPIRVHYYGHTGLPATQQCTQTPQSSVRRPLPPICVHYCDPKAIHNPSSQPNSVHKRPKLAQRAPILPFVYTITVTRGYPRRNSVHKRSKSVPGGSYRPFVYTVAVPCSPRKPTDILVKHVFKLEDLVVVEAPSQMVIINGVGATADVTLGNSFSALALGKHVPVFSDCSVRSVR